MTEREDAGATNPSAAVDEAFDAIEPLGAGARTAALDRLDPAIAARVRALLDAADQPGILDRAPVAAPAAGEGRALAAGTAIGGFVIERLIGRGGMGEVYCAHRAGRDFEQRVALKMLRDDAIADEAAFARERRVLARLHHPNIARLIDGGLAATGQPWMAMDHIEGAPIDRWCAAHRPSLDARLAMFRAICDAVAFAHANLVVHRDLKPSNILVDAGGRPVLLDFGIAKLIEDESGNTIAPAGPMTPDYAAPEQLENGAITVATDIYALGVILCQLLTGSTPWRRGGGTLATIVQRILAEDPQPPSRIAGDGAIPAARLRGDLDAIALKALRRDPADRYATVTEMAGDIARYAAARPVRARAGSRRYRLGRYLRRNRVAVAAAAAVLLALIGGSIGIALQAHRAAIERDNALAEARRSDSIVQTLTLMFGQAGQARDATLRETLDTSATHMLATLDGSARSGAIVAALSDLYVNMQDGKGSYDLVKRALAQGIGRDDRFATAQLQANLADAAVSLGTDDDAAGLLDRAERIFAADPDRYAVPLQQILLTRAAMARHKGDYDRAIALFEGSLDKAEHALAENRSALLTLYNNLLIYLIEANRADEAGAVFAQADRIIHRPGQTDAIQALGIDQIRAAWLLRKGDAAAAEGVSRSIVARRRRLFGPSAGLATDLSQMAKIAVARGEYPVALAALAEARPMAQHYLGPHAIPVVTMTLSLAQARAQTGDAAGAREAVREAAAAIAPLPAPNPLQPQLAMTEAVVNLAAGDKAGASAAVAKARAGFTALGPAGAGGLAALQKIEAKIGK